MWKQPDNIPESDWQALTQYWDDHKQAVYDRFHAHEPAVPSARIDKIVSELLGIYYQTEQNVDKGADFFQQLKDEFHKGFWVENEILQLKNDYPSLREPSMVKFHNEEHLCTLADHCMGGIVYTFIQMTSQVCRDRFGKPYGDTEKGLRNGILEKTSWGPILNDYLDQLKAHYDGDVPLPPLYRQ
jgi:hypothetical protein